MSSSGGHQRGKRRIKYRVLITFDCKENDDERTKKQNKKRGADYAQHEGGSFYFSCNSGSKIKRNIYFCDEHLNCTKRRRVCCPKYGDPADHVTIVEESEGVHATELKDPAESSMRGKQHLFTKLCGVHISCSHVDNLLLSVRSSFILAQNGSYSALQYAKAAITAHHASSKAIKW